ncbi:uncharacterized protein [Choristoneura fumiferana]|uniref:uncharacterized protein n=1 Tax=Choristoneura fumiferana TaxID=7141 RepID=UPI003D157D48
MARGIKLAESLDRGFYEVYSTHSPSILFGVKPSDRRHLKAISWIIILQCLAAYLVTVSVFSCLWNPENGFFELDILFRVMYLYDTDACGAQVHIMHIDELVLSNETYGLAVLPIKHRSPLMSVISQLPEKTKNYLIMSVCLHTFWLATALILRVFINVEDLEVFVIVLRIVYFTSLFVIFFDICLGVVYIAHIQQSLTKGMILRYSGWGKVRGINNIDEFGGWVPMIASAAWMRGIIVLIVNIFNCKVIRFIIGKIKKKKVKRRLADKTNIPFPDSRNSQFTDGNSLYFRTGESTPYCGKRYLSDLE